jgi:hypothetical protein
MHNPFDILFDGTAILRLSKHPHELTFIKTRFNRNEAMQELEKEVRRVVSKYLKAVTLKDDTVTRQRTPTSKSTDLERMQHIAPMEISGGSWVEPSEIREAVFSPYTVDMTTRGYAYTQTTDPLTSEAMVRLTTDLEIARQNEALYRSRRSTVGNLPF